MSNWWKYVAVSVGTVAIVGTAGLAGSYLSYKKGVTEGKNSPEYLIKDINGDGDDDLCVRINRFDAVCSIDIDDDGAQDIVYLDGETEKIKDIKYGKKKCLIPMPLEEKVQ